MDSAPIRVLPILAMGGINLALDEPMQDLKPVVTEALGKPVRRIGRFIQLSLIGAARCLSGTQPAPQTGIYFASGAGDINVTVEVLERIFRDQQSPKPISFINTVSNAACFYVARQFGLNGSATFVSRRRTPLQAAMGLALNEALVTDDFVGLIGAVDEGSMPLERHRARLGAPSDLPVGEGGWWLHAGAPTALDSLPNGALGALVRTENTFSIDGLAEELFQRSAEGSPKTWLGLGTWLSDADRAALEETGTSVLPDPVVDGWHDSVMGASLNAALNNPDLSGGRYIHIDRDPEGAYAIVELAIGRHHHAR